MRGDFIFWIAVGVFLGAGLMGALVVSTGPDFQPIYVNENNTISYYPEARISEAAWSDDYIIYVENGALMQRNIGDEMYGEWFKETYNGTVTVFVFRSGQCGA
ncbi:hypothetical protein MettiDRAFT_0828 [Methanolobus tindarius DSM 2278]|uniref:Uncharacterized protein n=1 Tax=Methanolobus tindarius DSM 2278 TaxID=1090322 RepID=W9DN53_METTI|nr:hypothetical protein [Methanolobus tindarius]ETA67404.1 hypothetical protein MettiDRAFT_0828 [Methanolobus tindarius DSM 2278]